MTTLKVSSPAELISAVPFLIGFHPADSLAVVAMQGPRVTFAVRTDLPEHHAPEAQARAAVLHLAMVVLEQQAEAVTIIGYGEASRVTPAVLRVSEVFRKASLTIVDELRVADGRYWSYLCTDLSCCPQEGKPCEPSNSVVAAQATFAGAVALPNREALSAQLTSVQGDDREAMTAATARALLRLAALATEHPPPAAEVTPNGAERDSSRPAGQVSSDAGETPRFHDPKDPEVQVEPVAGCPGSPELGLGQVIWARLGISAPLPDEPDLVVDSLGLVPDENYFFALVRSAGRSAVQEAERCYSTGGRLSDDDAAWLGVLLLHMPVRDYAWTRTRTREWELALWSDLTRRVEPRYLPAPAALLAFVAWRTGLGPLASVALERALDQNPDYPLAVLMYGAIMTGVSPSALDGWPALNGMPLVVDAGQSPLRARPEVPATGRQDGTGGEGPDRFQERPRKSRRATRRRI